MANADPINHDSASTVATVGAKVAKWGAIGGLIALAIPLAATAATVGLGVLAFSSFSAGAATAGILATLGAVAAAATGVAATTTYLGGVGISTLIGGAAVGGAALGVFKGADQVSKENSAFRAKVTARMNDTGNKEAKIFNDGEIKGIDEGYTLAVNDLKPQMEAAREQGRQEGAQMVVQQIQEHMQQEMAAQQQAPEAHHGKQHRMDGAHDNKGVKPPVQIGSKVIASCECPDGSKAAAIAEQRQTTEATHTV